MAKKIKELPGEIIFEPVDKKLCEVCQIRETLCNRFGDNGYRSLVVVATRVEKVGCDAQDLLLAKRAEQG